VIESGLLKYLEIVVFENPVYAAISANVTFFFAIFLPPIFIFIITQNHSGINKRISKVTGFVELHKTFSLFLEIATKIGKMLDNPLLPWYDVISKVTGYLTRNGGKQE
jgi:hypothetical protein